MKVAGAARKPSQAGRFYPADPDELRSTVEHHIQSAVLCDAARPWVGFVSPHAGYTFSGATAGHSYRHLQEQSPKTIFVFAPSHHAAFTLASTWDGGAYSTPLGDYAIDQEVVEHLRKRLPGLGCKKWADEVEHSLEVQVPFLQVACPDAKMVPLLLGSQEKENVEALAEGVATVCEGMSPGEVAFVASSDAYHGHSVEDCHESDEQLMHVLTQMDIEALYRDVDSGRTMACGYGPIALVVALSRHMGAGRATVLNHATSADFLPHRAGDYVVGYLSAMFH